MQVMVDNWRPDFSLTETHSMMMDFESLRVTKTYLSYQ